MTRQQRWANAQKAKGLCSRCCQPAVGLYCAHHADLHRKRQAAAYRAKVNKPLDSNQQTTTLTTP